MTIFQLIKAEWRPWFRKFKWLPGKERQTWSAWFTFLRVLFGLKLSDDDVALFQQCTGRSDAPASGFNEAWLICGRRSGKSLMLAMIAIYVAVFRDWTPFLQPGERGTVMVLSADRKQSRTIFRYALAFLKALDVVTIERETADTIELSNGISIEIATASYKTVRGYTVVAALLDEAAFWSDEGANPDQEILAALRPSMATIPGALLLVASSPYAKRGILYDAFQRHYGRDGDSVLVWRAATQVMNPSVPDDFIRAEYEKDPSSAAAEFGAEFRNDISGWADRALIEAAVEHGLTVRAPLPGISYKAFCDPSGGSKDSFTAAVAHAEGTNATLDCLIEVRAPFNPDEAVAQIADVLRSYGISRCTSDRYAAQWPVAAFARHGITLVHSDRDRSQIYLDVLPLFTTGRCRLLDNDKLITQFAGLVRTTSPSGRDKIDHGKTGADDLCNSCAGALVLTAAPQRRPFYAVGVRDPDKPDDHGLSDFKHFGAFQPPEMRAKLAKTIADKLGVTPAEVDALADESHEDYEYERQLNLDAGEMTWHEQRKRILGGGDWKAKVDGPLFSLVGNGRRDVPRGGLTASETETSNKQSGNAMPVTINHASLLDPRRAQAIKVLVNRLRSLGVSINHPEQLIDEGLLDQQLAGQDAALRASLKDDLRRLNLI